MDPLRRSNEPEEEKGPGYYKGFFDAEKRRKVVNHNPTLRDVVVNSVFATLPFVLIYFVMRSSARISEVGRAPGQKPGSFMSEIRKAMERTMNPLGPKDFRVTVKDTRFADIIGIPEALAEVQQYVDFLKTPEKFTRLGGHLPKGCILTGKPGTGKTLLAKAVAGEADVPFFTCSGADFIEIYAGSGPKRVRELFETAKKDTPSVIFIDEIDAIGSRNTSGGALGLSGEENRTVNQLLSELDGIQPSEAIIVFAATNFVDNIDKALLREGRFDRKVEIPIPDMAAREKIFRHYLGRIVTKDSLVQPKRLAELTPGVSPATIAAIVNEAALNATIRGREAVTTIDLLPAIDDVLIGKKHRNRMSEKGVRRVALRESGRALIAWLLPEQTDVIKVSITPRGSSVGFTQQIGREALDMSTEFSLFTDICVMLAGRLAELTQHDDLTTGSQDDFQRATQTAIFNFLAFGMSPQNVGLLSFDPQRFKEGRVFQKHSEEAQKMAEAEAIRLIGVANDFVKGVLHKNQHTLQKLSEALFEKKELLREELEAIIGARNATITAITVEARAALARFTKLSEEAALQSLAH